MTSENLCCGSGLTFLILPYAWITWSWTSCRYKCSNVIKPQRRPPDQGQRRCFYLVFTGISGELLQLRVELHKLLRHTVDASV